SQQRRWLIDGCGGCSTKCSRSRRGRGTRIVTSPCHARFCTTAVFRWAPLGFFFLPKEVSIGQLRARMEQDLKLKGFSPATIRNYLLYCRKFAAFYMRSPEELGEAEVRSFLIHAIEVEQLAYSSYRQLYSALKFLYNVTLRRPDVVGRI